MIEFVLGFLLGEVVMFITLVLIQASKDDHDE